MDLSYAQHLEDFHLSRVFDAQKEGFYIDVGGGHPVADNVSCALYLRGWRGLVIEPQAHLTELYRHIRPRDEVFCGVLGREAGAADFFLVERLHGFSTTVAEFAEKALEYGAGFQRSRVPMTTLAALCAQRDIRHIDFLKIDVEGSEGDVLAGNDWRRFRPRVIVCEALAPGSLAENWHEWEPALLAQDYAFVLFDGLNRWYVAVEDRDLLDRFPRSRAEWLAVPHLGHTNRAPFRDDHPDHHFAQALVGGFLAALPRLDRALLLSLVLHGESGDLDAPVTLADRARVIARMFPSEKFAHASVGLDTIAAPTLREFYAKVLDTDHFRVMTGRLAMSYDGGQILD